MAESKRDLWSEWLLNRRFAGNADQLKAMLDHLYPIRDKILVQAGFSEDQVLLDIGCGDGLIGFGALEKVSTAKVIFTDVSQDLLDHAEQIANGMGVLERCTFLRAPAEDLSAIPDESVDVVTTRSVLIYVSEKRQAFQEFYRVLKRDGRISLFEPINAFGYPTEAADWWGFDVTAVIEIAQKLKDFYQRIQPPGKDPMLDFDERDLLAFADGAGFKEIHLDYQAEISHKKRGKSGMDWDTMLRLAPNPKMPTLEEAMRAVLTPGEAEAFVAHLRPLFEADQCTYRTAVAYLWARK